MKANKSLPYGMTRYTSKKPLCILNNAINRVSICIGKMTSGEYAGRVFYIVAHGSGSRSPAGEWNVLLPAAFSERGTFTVGEVVKQILQDKTGEGEVYLRFPDDLLYTLETVLRVTEDEVVL